MKGYGTDRQKLDWGETFGKNGLVELFIFFSRFCIKLMSASDLGGKTHFTVLHPKLLRADHDR